MPPPFHGGGGERKKTMFILQNITCPYCDKVFSNIANTPEALDKAELERDQARRWALYYQKLSNKYLEANIKLMANFETAMGALENIYVGVVSLSNEQSEQADYYHSVAVQAVDKIRANLEDEQAKGK
jgi:hypothetical protein